MVASVSTVETVPDNLLSSPSLAVARASLSIIGHKAYAIYGVDLSEGEAEYVFVKRQAGEPLHEAQRRAAYKALEKLEGRLGHPLIYFWTPYPPVARVGE